MEHPPHSDSLSFIAKPTQRLLSLVLDYKRTLLPEIYRATTEDIHSVFLKYSAALKATSPGPQRAHQLHRLLGQTMEDASGIPLSCQKGCSGCCHFEVEVLQDEAELLASCIPNNIQIDQARLRTQAARERKDPAWSRFFAPENRCVFLDANGACGVYENRPAACRRLIVTSPAASCTTPGATVEPVNLLLSEILMSAAISMEDTHLGSLPQLLLKALPPEH